MRVELAEAIERLRAGEQVAIPTETVYGLAADATNPTAVAGIFEKKGRPAGHPLIVHVAQVEDAARYAEVPPAAAKLMAAFWPGPLTLLLPRTPALVARLAPEVSGGHTSLGVRMPAHPLALAVIAGLGRPVAAPSANRFGRVSPTTAAHVAAELPGVAVLDGGACGVGVESTIIDCTGEVLALVRPGGVPTADIEARVGPLQRGSATPAPGTLASHYAPSTRLLASHAPDDDAARLVAAGQRVAVLRASDPRDYAVSLYARLRQLDSEGWDALVIEWAAAEGLGEAVNDRIRRACVPPGVSRE